jgi:hypothetical protein
VGSRGKAGVGRARAHVRSPLVKYTPPVFDLGLMLSLIADGLKAREKSLTREQAVRGIDALEEVELHPILARSLRAAGFGVLREQPYPSEWKAKRGRSGGKDLPEHRDRQRCDLVVTPQKDQKLGDELAEERAARELRLRTAGTLFEGHAAAATVPADPGRVAPEDAYWLEVKLVRQFDLSAGNAGPNRSYASELVRHTRTDLAKLAGDGRVQAGGLALVLFTADAATADHDLGVLMHKCLDKDLPVASPLTQRVQIVERMGNGACTVSLIPLRTR